MQLTQHFTKAEFESSDGAKMPASVLENIKKVAQNLQVLRDFLQKPIYINSGYRSPALNDKLVAQGKAVKNSYHTKGQAADIVIQGLTPEQTFNIIENLITQKKMLQGGVGLYDTFVHYDIRGNKARWDLRSSPKKTQKKK